MKRPRAPLALVRLAWFARGWLAYGAACWSVDRGWLYWLGPYRRYLWRRRFEARR